uniref:NADH-ubiquinone oxidoreductase chain 6 n=1 Tax=Graptodytes pietrii TaxID=992552 RepID=A0A894JNT2_9DYTI|nr:NADH dehydrogenase subunit 6 [Graptodytes pietrii]
MMFILIFMNLIMSSIFLCLNHPMSMGFILMIQSMIIALYTGMYSYSFWFSYILFLIMIGGMLILFMYMTSLASNEKFKFSLNISLMIFYFLLILLFIYFSMDYFLTNLFFKNSNLLEIINSNLFKKNENNLSINLMYNNPNNLITMILINYLFLTLIAIVKITKSNTGPLRQKF